MYGIYVFEINENGTKGIEKTITDNMNKVNSIMSDESKKYFASHNLHVNIVHNGKSIFEM
jgi:hypothetical protein